MLNRPIVKKCSFLGGLLLSSHLIYAANQETSASDEQQTRRIYMLEKSLAPINPKGVAAKWAEAVKNRNGAVQYMLECPELQKTTLNNFIELNWVTGVSSPWVASYTMTSQQTKNDIWNFTIRYKLTSSSPIDWANIDKISVVRLKNNDDSSQQWCISQLKQSSTEKK